MSSRDAPTLEAGKYVLRFGTPIQLIGIILLYLVGLSGFDYIYGKKRAYLLLLGYDSGTGLQIRRGDVFGGSVHYIP